MKMTSKAVLHGIKQSKGEIEGRPFDSTTFHLSVDIAQTSSGESIGVVTRPFKLGDSTEFQKWAHLKNAWPLGGVMCECEFDIVAGSENTTKLTLLAIKPAATAKAA
ncbi:hypothetical protein IB236_00910 [Acidovorax sp. ACV02]|uniref:hypothetical protein n=1 Tax=Acidovorax sp. ACV02 TaxID=2769310 RepID=UPI001780EE47|nr:hypothetical protein [Acidovorax sp. ACV02]MBD9403866.1 hypothetical protein [Acidovorax sp. ACV02]